MGSQCGSLSFDFAKALIFSITFASLEQPSASGHKILLRSHCCSVVEAGISRADVLTRSRGYRRAEEFRSAQTKAKFGRESCTKQRK